jgi:hypothetical protein
MASYSSSSSNALGAGVLSVASGGAGPASGGQTISGLSSRTAAEKLQAKASAKAKKTKSDNDGRGTDHDRSQGSAPPSSPASSVVIPEVGKAPPHPSSASSGMDRREDDANSDAHRARSRSRESKGSPRSPLKKAASPPPKGRAPGRPERSNGSPAAPSSRIREQDESHAGRSSRSPSRSSHRSRSRDRKRSASRERRRPRSRDRKRSRSRGKHERSRDNRRSRSRSSSESESAHRSSRPRHDDGPMAALRQLLEGGLSAIRKEMDNRLAQNTDGHAADHSTADGHEADAPEDEDELDSSTSTESWAKTLSTPELFHPQWWDAPKATATDSKERREQLQAAATAREGCTPLLKKPSERKKILVRSAHALTIERCKNVPAIPRLSKKEVSGIPTEQLVTIAKETLEKELPAALVRNTDSLRQVSSLLACVDVSPDDMKEALMDIARILMDNNVKLASVMAKFAMRGLHGYEAPSDKKKEAPPINSLLATHPDLAAALVNKRDSKIVAEALAKASKSDDKPKKGTASSKESPVSLHRTLTTPLLTSTPTTLSDYNSSTPVMIAGETKKTFTASSRGGRGGGRGSSYVTPSTRGGRGGRGNSSYRGSDRRGRGGRGRGVAAVQST